MIFIKNILEIILIVFLTIFIFLSSNILPISYKKDIALDFIPKKYRLQHKTGNKEEILQSYQNFRFPLIIKPNRCSTCGNNVYKTYNLSELKNVLKTFPHDYIMIQELDEQEFEGAILYEKWPNSEKGKIISIIQKVPKSEEKVPLNLQTSTIKDISYLNNLDLENLIERISSKIPGFYVGRYDIKFDSEQDLKSGNFKILELNSAFGLDLSLYDKSTEHLTLKKVPGQLRWFLKRILIGLINLVNPQNNILEIIKNKIKEISNICHCPKLSIDILKMSKCLVIPFLIYSLF